jgi:hypothetical protein
MKFLHISMHIYNLFKKYFGRDLIKIHLIESSVNIIHLNDIYIFMHINIFEIKKK